MRAWERAWESFNFNLTYSGYYEDSHYHKGHFQSVCPTTTSPVLQTILDNGGFDVAEYYNLPALDDEDEDVVDEVFEADPRMDEAFAATLEWCEKFTDACRTGDQKA